MSKARFLSSALDGQTVTLTAMQGGVTVGPNTISAWKQPDNSWSGVGPATLTIDAQEIVPSEGTFAPYPVEWRIRVSGGTSYATPDWAPAFADPYHTSLGAGDEDTIRLAIEAYDPSYQRCQFVVHTGDTGNYRNDWVGSQAHRNKAFQYGQNCGHVYSDPGSYTGRSVYVYDDEGNWGTATLPDLVVTNPDTDFDSASTIVVSPTSDWTGSPTHDLANRCTTMDEASARFAAIKNGVTAGVRICVQSGASFSERADVFSTRDAKGVCLVDTYGGSTQFTYSERNLDVPVNGDALFLVDSVPAWAWRIKNGLFDLGYDILNGRPTNPDGWLGGSNTMSRSFFECSYPATIYGDVLFPSPVKGDPAARIAFDNLDITGCGWFCISTLGGSGEIQGRNVAIFANDCEFYGNPEYAFFTPQSLFALGTKVRALEGGDLGGMGRSMAMGTSRGWTSHPIFLREQFAWTVYVRACYVETRGGWSGISSSTVYRGGQPMMRLNNRGINEIEYDANTGWMNGRGRRYYFCDSAMSGYFNLDIAGDLVESTSGQSVGGAHVVIENCMFFGDPMNGGRESILYEFGPRHSIRNCMFLATNEGDYWLDGMPGRDVTRFDPTDNRFGRFRQFITNDADNNFKVGGRVENRHNTFVMLRTTANIEFGTFNIRGPAHKALAWDAPNPSNADQAFDESAQEMVEGHNVLHAPNLDVPEGVASVSAIDLPAGMRMLDPWLRFTWESKRFVLASDLVDGAISPAIEYPVDWYNNPTTGADYAGSASTNSIAGPVADLNYDALTADFVVGETLTGATSGVTGVIVSITPATATTGAMKVLIAGSADPDFANNELITSASGSATAQGSSNRNQRWFEPPANFPNNGGRQTVPKNNVDMLTVIHDCNSSGVVQGDGSGTYFKIQNRSGETWPAGDYRAILDRGSTGMTPETPATAGTSLVAVDQTEFKLYRPTTPQTLDGGLGSTLFDFNRNLRPNAGYAISPTSGTNAAGALLPEL